ncbi:MAG: PQQ-dependent sugar dehydrogenase [Planctomycetota bacterium]
MNARLTVAALLLAVLPVVATAQSGPVARGGYEIETLSTLLPDFPTAITLDDVGRVYCITTNGGIYRFTPPFGGALQAPELWFDGTSTLLPYCTAATWHAGKMYVGHRGKISTIEDTTGDDLGDTVVDIITGLPSGVPPFTADHQNNQIVFDDAGHFYFGIGSQTDSGPETQPWSATIMRADADGSNLQIHATGIRNAFGLAFHPLRGLFAGDNGPNYLTGGPDPVDELNWIQAGADYGYPDYYGMPPAGTGTKNPAFQFPAHAAPTGMTFDELGQWSGQDGDLYVCLFAMGAGAIVRVSLDQRNGTDDHDGYMQAIAFNFTTVIDCRFTDQGELICADFLQKKLYRIVPSDTSRIRLSGPTRRGDLISVELEDPNEAGDYLVCALSDSETPPLLLPNGEVFHLNVNTYAFNYTTAPNNGVLGFPSPFLDPTGKSTGYLYIPDEPFLEGLTFSMGFVSVQIPGLTFGSVSEPLPFVVLPSE